MSVEPALLAGETAKPAPKRGLPGRLARDGGIIFGTVIILFMILIGLAAPWLGSNVASWTAYLLGSEVEPLRGARVGHIHRHAVHLAVVQV